MRARPAWRRAVRLLVLCLALLPSLPARAQEVDLLLVLAVDASGSVNAERFALQKQGYVAAFRNPRLLRAIQGGMIGAIGVAMTQWTGPEMQMLVVPWMRISDAGSSAAFADAIDAAPRQLFSGGTSLSGAIFHAAGLLAQAPFSAARRVIDISGDGANNRGTPVALARDAAIAQGITINGLPILGLEPDLDLYYRENVIGGPGAFLIAAEDFAHFADAILRKLIIEIADRRPAPRSPAPTSPPATSPPATSPSAAGTGFHNLVSGR